VTAWFLTIAIIYFLAPVNPITVSPPYNNVLVYWVFGMPLFLLFYKVSCPIFFHHLTRFGYFTRNVVIIGAGKHAESLILKLLRSAEAEQLNIRGLFDDRSDRIPTAIQGVPVRGTTDDLIDFVRREGIDEVLIALPLADGERLLSLRHKLQSLAIDARLSLEPLPGDFQARTVDYLGNARVLDVVERPLRGWDGVIIKALLDKSLSLIGLICIVPLMLLIAALIKLDSRGPVFFVQKRFGRNNSVIEVLKFRTMHLSYGDPSGQRRTIRNDPRVTRIGRVLRRLSLDELPQLINVIRGDMSLVGPRPHAIAMMAGNQLYHEAVADYPRRHRVKPGITGWAQVNGSRGEIDTLTKAHTRVQLDLYYIDHWSVWLDVRILLKTAGLLLCKGAY
jgi:Undecaprenyl-phosphate glucose phosphotransferase